MAKVRVPKPKILAVSLPALLIVAVIGWLAGTWLGDQPRWILWTVRSLIWAFGMLAIVLVMRMLKGSGPPAARAEPDPIDGLLEQATKRLNAIGVRGRRALGRMPVVLLLGPRGSAKTTFVLRSDLDADLLAGNMPSGEMATPTDALNLWYRDGQAIVEAGGQMSVDQARWARLVEKLKPRQLIPALLGRSQAPRVAVVCLSVEDLTLPGTGDSYLAAARTLRARLTELAEGIGIRLPVYVVFTKADRISHFEEFAKNLTDNEVHELLGATLRSSADAATGSYAERETERLSRAMEELFQGLSERRLEVLNRAATTQGNGAAYEFPREFRKVCKPAVQFLLELCRPNQLRVSAFLRGFYFTGVRPIVAQDAMHQPAHVQAFNPQASAAAGATQVFRLDDLQPPSARLVAPARGGERRIPQWVFLDRILQRVVLADRVAMGITSSGIGLSVLRRASMAACIAFFLFLGGATVVAYSHESRLQEEARTAVAGVEELGASQAGMVTLSTLQRLEALRAVTEKLSHYENDDAPPRRLIFMYTGEDLYRETRNAYFSRFRTLLFNQAFTALKSNLGQPPAQPSSDQFDRIYRSLKAYVEITEPAYNDSATAEFFGPVLTEHWLGINSPDAETRDLAARQFAFYGAELPYESPFPVEASDGNLTNGVRAFLSKNTDDESFYGRLLGRWSRLPPARIAFDRPETSGFLRDVPEVHGAYTRAGWDSVHASLSSTSQSFSTHVVGLDFFQALNVRGFELGTLPERLRTRYEQTYRDEWLRFLSLAQTDRRELAQAQSFLNDLGGNRSALFRLFAYVDSQTHVGAPVVDSTFTALRVLTGPDTLPLRISEKPGLEYLGQIRTLAAAIGALVAAPGPATSAEVQKIANAGTAYVDGIFVNFPAVIPGARETTDAAARMLKQPFSMASQYAGGTPALMADGKAEAFCSQWVPLVFQKFPFRRAATEEAAIADIDALLNPQKGALNTFLGEVDQLGASGAVLTQAYSTFRTNVRELASVFYPAGSTGPSFRIRYRMTGITGDDRVDVLVDGQPRAFTDRDRDPETFVWDGARASQVRLDIRLGGRSETLQFAGPWALFRFFEKGSWQPPLAGGGSVVTWSTPGGAALSAEVIGGPVLNPRYLAGFACPRDVAR